MNTTTARPRFSVRSLWSAGAVLMLGALTLTGCGGDPAPQTTANPHFSESAAAAAKEREKYASASPDASGQASASSSSGTGGSASSTADASAAPSNSASAGASLPEDGSADSEVSSTDQAQEVLSKAFADQVPDPDTYTFTATESDGAYVVQVDRTAAEGRTTVAHYMVQPDGSFAKS